LQLKLLTVLTDDINDPISSDIMCYVGHQTHVEHINQATILQSVVQDRCLQIPLCWGLH